MTDFMKMHSNRPTIAVLFRGAFTMLAGCDAGDYILTDEDAATAASTKP